MWRFSLVVGIMLLTLVSCNRGGQDPLTPGQPALSPTLGSLAGQFEVSHSLGMAEGIPGGWTWTITADPPAAEAVPWRSNATIQGKLFDLDVTSFFQGNPLQITGVRTDTAGDIVVDYQITHPFAAPDFTRPISASNRADLGFSGRLIFLVDVPAAQVAQRSFFGGSVIANTDVILNANHFMRPGTLLLADTGSFNANAFPVRLVVDELRNAGQGNRVGVPNGGDPRGNYNAAAGGWQRSNIGAANDGWTGYDVLHQGQRATSALTISKDFIGSTQAKFDVALMIKYTDPRGVPFPQNPQVRMPQDPADPSVFAYRMPNGALDVSDIKYKSLPTRVLTLGAASGASAELTARVRDWDARAAETAEAVLANDADLAKVNLGTSGVPEVTLSAPALSASVFPLPTAGGQSGRPGDELELTGTIINELGTAPAGSRQVALLRVADPEQNAPGRNTYHFGVDPVTLAGDPGRALEVITYQPLYIDIPDGNTAPSCGSLGINGSTSIAVGGTFTVNLAGASDAQGDDVTVTLAYTGPANASTSSLTLTSAQLAGESAFNPFTDPRLTSKLTPPALLGSYVLQVTLSDGKAAPVVCSRNFTVVANQAAGCGSTGINEPGPFAKPVDFKLNLSSITDPDSAQLTLRFGYTGPESAISSGLSIATSALGSESAFNPYSDPRLQFPLRRPVLDGAYNFIVEISDGTGATSCGPYAFTVLADPDLPPSCGELGTQFPKLIVQEGSFGVDLTSLSDPDSPSLTLQFSYTGPASAATSELTLTLPQLGVETAFDPFNDERFATKLATTSAEGDFELTIAISDGTNQVLCGPFPFRIEGVQNRQPECGTLTPHLNNPLAALSQFTIDLSGASDPDDDPLHMTFSYRGPVNSSTSTLLFTSGERQQETFFNPFADPRLGAKLAPLAVTGLYTLEVRLDDGISFPTVCSYPFEVVPSGGTNPTLGWAHAWGGSFGFDTLFDVAVDQSGNSYAVGRFRGTVDFDPGPGVIERTATNVNGSPFIVSFGPEGTFQQVQVWGGGGEATAFRLVVDNQGNQYIAGAFNGTADFDPSENVQNRTSKGLSDCFILALQAMTHFNWVAVWGGSQADFPLQIRFDPAGNLWTTGGFESTVDFDPGEEEDLRTAIGSDAFLLSLTSSGQYRTVITLDPTADAIAHGHSMAIGPDGYVYWAGIWEGVKDLRPGPGTDTRTSIYSTGFLISIHESGAFQWLRTVGEDVGVIPIGLFRDARGNATWLVDYYAAPDLDPGLGVFRQDVASGQGIGLVSLNPNGDTRWVRAIGEPDAVVFTGASPGQDAADNYYLAGFLRGSVDADPGPDVFTFAGEGANFHGYCIRLNAEGVFTHGELWGPQLFRPQAITPIPDGSALWLGGHFQGTVDFDPGPGVASRVSNGDNDCFLLRLDL